MKNSKFTLTLIASAISVALCAPVSSVFAVGGEKLNKLQTIKAEHSTSNTKTKSKGHKSNKKHDQKSMKKHKMKKSMKKNKVSEG